MSRDGNPVVCRWKVMDWPGWYEVLLSGRGSAMLRDVWNDPSAPVTLNPSLSCLVAVRHRLDWHVHFTPNRNSAGLPRPSVQSVCTLAGNV